MTTMIQDKDGVIAATPSTMPSDRHFRNAWVFDSNQNAISEDIAAAKTPTKSNPLMPAGDSVRIKIGNI